MTDLESFNMGNQRHRPSRSISEHPPQLETNMLDTEIMRQQREDKDLLVNSTVNKCLKPTCLILQHVVSYPFIILRRQCQVYHVLFSNYTCPIAYNQRHIWE